MSAANPRGTSNGNCSGNSEARRRRKVRLVGHWRADVDLVTVDQFVELCQAFTQDNPGPRIAAGAELGSIRTFGVPTDWIAVQRGLGQPACRCYRCGRLLTKETATADRIKPGAEGGTYAFPNLRPACGSCNSITGNEYRWAKARVLESV